MRYLAVGHERVGAVGRSIPDVQAVSKATGALRFLQDISVPGMLHASMVLAGRPYAAVRRVSVSKALSVEGVVAVATSQDVPGRNRIGLIVDDQPLFADRMVRYEADCVAIVGGEDVGAASRAAALVEIEYDDMPPVTTLADAKDPSSPPIHDSGKIAVERDLIKGDISEGESRSDFLVELELESPVQEHAYLEPLGALAVPLPEGGIDIMVPGQCPFYVRDAVARCLRLPLSMVRVIQLPMGGGFGGREDVPSEICARLAVLACKSGRPARLLLTREEDLIYSSKRHPMQMEYRMGCDSQGKLTFADIKIDADVGAYATLSPIVLFRSSVHAAGPYEIPNVRVRTRGYYTNTVPKGAMRGFGTPQVVFACESLIEELAGRAGLDPLEFRIRNALRAGGRTATGQVLDDSCGFAESLSMAKEMIGDDRDWYKPREKGNHVLAAKGVASMFYGVSLGAAGRTLDRGSAKVEVLKDGSVSVFIGCTDMGQGALTVLSQIAAEAFGIGHERISVKRVDTSIVPDSGPTVASRTTVVSGNAIVDACDKIKRRMQQVGVSIIGAGAVYDSSAGGVISKGNGTRLPFNEIVRECVSRRVDLAATGWYVVPDCRLDEETGQGKAYHVYSYATDLAEVEVDIEIGRVRVTSFVAIHDSGTIMNPLTAAGQVEGGVVQGMGLAIHEGFSQIEGRVQSRDLSTYLIPTAVDVCDDIRVRFVERASADGPFGAKGLGEPAIIPVASAIANAVSNAVGVRVRKLPVDRHWISRTAARHRPESA
jgi:CO/xanthine dehydrogenase Mo-binding subunit